MNANEILDVIGDAKGSYVWDAQEVRSGAGAQSKKKPSIRRGWLIAAIVALMLLLVGCTVVYVLSLQDMKVGEYTYEEPAFTDPNGETVPATEWTTTLISLQGYNGSPNQMALQEWLEFQNSYDQDGTLLDANNFNESGIPENYNRTYFCYTWEMVDKLDEILEKYDLKMLSAAVPIQQWQNAILFDALQIDGVCREEAQAQVEYGSGYFYPEGTFDFTTDVTLTGEDAQWTKEILLSLRYSLKAYFDPVPYSLGVLESYEQWHYTLTDGTDVLLALNQDGAIMICDKGDALITVTMHDYSDTENLSKQAVEQLAQVIDFSIQPQKADMEKVEKMLEESVEPYDSEAHHFYMGFRIALSDGTWYPPEGYSDSFSSYFAYTREHANEKSAPKYRYYSLMDLDGDEEDEVIWANEDGNLFEVWDMKNGAVAIRFITYVCEGNVLERYLQEEDYIAHEYSDLSGRIVAVKYIPGADRWEKDLDGNSVTDEDCVAITEEEAKEIIHSYPRIELDLRPVSEYPQ